MKNRVGRVGYAGCRIAGVRLKQKVFCREFGNLLTDHICKFRGCDNNDVLRRDEVLKSLIGVPDETLANIGEVEELLWAVAAADWPQTLAVTSGHNYAIGVIYVHINVLVLFEYLFGLSKI